MTRFVGFFSGYIIWQKNKKKILNFWGFVLFSPNFWHFWGHTSKNSRCLWVERQNWNLMMFPPHLILANHFNEKGFYARRDWKREELSRHFRCFWSFRNEKNFFFISTSFFPSYFLISKTPPPLVIFFYFHNQKSFVRFCDNQMNDKREWERNRNRKKIFFFFWF